MNFDTSETTQNHNTRYTQQISDSPSNVTEDAHCLIGATMLLGGSQHFKAVSKVGEYTFYILRLLIPMRVKRTVP